MRRVFIREYTVKSFIKRIEEALKANGVFVSGRVIGSQVCATYDLPDVVSKEIAKEPSKEVTSKPVKQEEIVKDMSEPQPDIQGNVTKEVVVPVEDIIDGFESKEELLEYAEKANVKVSKRLTLENMKEALKKELK